MCAHRHAFEGRDDAPQGLQGADAVEWEVELVSYEKEGHWQVRGDALNGKEGHWQVGDVQCLKGGALAGEMLRFDWKGIGRGSARNECCVYVRRAGCHRAAPRP